MSKRTNSFMRTMAALSGAGLLLQTGGCTVDLNAIGQTLATSTLNTLLTTWVFGLFNVPLSGF